MLISKEDQLLSIEQEKGEVDKMSKQLDSKPTALEATLRFILQGVRCMLAWVAPPLIYTSQDIIYA